MLYQKKKLVMNTLLGVEMRSLGRQLGELAAQDRYARELPRAGLLEALIETTACVPAYRTYIRSLEVPAGRAGIYRPARCLRLANASRTLMRQL